jgi:nucleotide-binding universal stress UspA family protein
MQTQVRDTALNEYDEKFLEPKRLKLEEEGFDVDTEVVFGSPGHMLALEADRMQAEALIIGKIGNSKAKDILFGSVASRLVQHCPCPLIIVP